ncbi:type 4a pilus biogenesis protein PilO [bacterium]|nr:type 4a pilus biogenesis protein PilO [bacterium]
MIASWIRILTEHRWYTLAGMVGLLCLYALTGELIPRTAELIRMRKDISENRSRIAQVEEWDFALQRMNRRKQSLNKQIETLVYSRQEKNQFSDIYAFLSGSAARVDVTLMYVRPGESEPGNRSVRLPILIRLNARYHALARYMNALETSDPIIQIESCMIEARDMTSEDLTIDLKIWVYFLT